jgi:hypothetical protein
MPTDERFHIELTALPGGDTSPVIRLRHALKVLLRRFGLKCTRAVEVPAAAPGVAQAAGADVSAANRERGGEG